MSGVGPSGVYRLMGLARRKALLMPVLSVAALVVSAVEGASGWILVWLAVFLGALVVVMWRLVNRVDVDGTGNVRFHRGLAGAVAVHVDEIREVRRTTWGFNVARVDAADEAVFVDLDRRASSTSAGGAAGVANGWPVPGRGGSSTGAALPGRYVRQQRCAALTGERRATGW